MNYIEPDNTHHQSLVDVEPVTGKMLRRAVRLQVQPTYLISFRRLFVVFMAPHYLARINL